MSQDMKETLSFNQVAAAMGLSRHNLSTFFEVAEDQTFQRLAQEAKWSARKRIDAHEFRAWWQNRGRRSPVMPMQDKIETYRSEQFLHNSSAFESIRDKLINAGWVEYARAGDSGYGYIRGRERFEFHASYVVHQWSDKLTDRWSKVYFRSTGTLQNEKDTVKKCESFEAFVRQTIAKEFDRKPAALKGQSFIEWALQPIDAP
jgi:inorganic triphosphatase YgiF